jgi:lipopolysaccharide transport system ATP-binding protein
MVDTVISGRGLGKRYHVGLERASYDTLREAIGRTVRAPVRRLRAHREPASQIWSLKDVSFDVERGQTVGLVGLNGAGKTTLLKVLARITEPTEGSAEIRGRVGSLLEAGAGFHPELTGRENIYLNGAILGMRKHETERRFDDIVSFAGVEGFVDTPVKRYSTGMYMRLAFSVAVHLEPDILFVDEVLSVGDAEFQRQCFAKMQEVALGDRTIVFVSHNMSAVRRICDRGLLLERGKLVADGPVDLVLDRYLARSAEEVAEMDQVATESFVVHGVRASAEGSEVVKTFEPFQISATVTARRTIQDPGLYVGVLSVDNQRIAGIDFKDFQSVQPMQAGDSTVFRFNIEAMPLLPGSYRLELHLKDLSSHSIEMVPKLYPFEVVETPVYGGRKLDQWFGHVGFRATASAEAMDRTFDEDV